MKLTYTKLTPAVIAAFAVSVAPFAHADESDILLKVLVRKGVLTEGEATTVRAEVAKEKAKEAKVAAAKAAAVLPAESKFDLSKPLEKLKLYGDLRLRYQYDATDAQFEPGVGVHSDRNEKDRSSSGTQDGRFRFRLRLNADYQFTDNLFAGVELQTGQVSDSGNQNFENGFSDYDIFISRAYMGWEPTKGVMLVGGKMPGYFYNTNMMWDGDLNPTGVFESIAFHKLGEEQFDEGLDKDGKKMLKPVEKPWELTLNAGQFVFDNNLEANFDNDSSTDAWLFYTQFVGSYKFDNGVKATIAPGYLTYINGSLSDVGNKGAFNDNRFVSGATRNLNLLLLPGDISFKLGGLKTRFYWDFSYNIEGRKRVEDVYNLVELASPENDPDDLRKKHSNVDDIAFLTGIKFGDNRKRGDWSMSFDYRQQGVGAIDPNLNDSDIFGSQLGLRGFTATGLYNINDFLTVGLLYSYGWNIRQDLSGGEATGGNSIANTNDVHTAIFDLQIKF
ncbi:MAG: putative porin [Chthoniobacteraceae bacterium]